MVIESLIKNTFALDLFNPLNVSFRSFFASEMALTKTPGIYANLPNNGHRIPIGAGLTGPGMRDVVDRARRYFDNAPADDQANQLIDDAFTPRKVIRQGERRWGNSFQAKIIANEWLTAIEELYLNGLTNQTDHFERCIMEFGWGNDMVERAAQHTRNTSTTYLFAVYHAITHRNNSQSLAQFTVFPIWERNTKLARTAEVLAHILGSSFWFSGGLNCSWAGGFSTPTASKHYRQRRFHQLLMNRFRV